MLTTPMVIVVLFAIVSRRSTVTAADNVQQCPGYPEIRSNKICSPRQDEITNLCQSDIYFDGINDGGRCYYLAQLLRLGQSLTEVRNWNQSWTECTTTGSQLAQIHSQVELQTIGDYLKTKVRREPESRPEPGSQHSPFQTGDPDTSAYFALALRDGPQTADLISPFWYDGPTAVIAGARAEKTFVGRFLATDDVSGTGSTSKCYFLTQESGSWAIKSQPCDAYRSGTYALCQLWSQSQNFTKTEICITEDPIESLSLSTAQECSERCAFRSWCRSFNFVSDGRQPEKRTCQMFTWHPNEDGFNYEESKRAPRCVNYVYA